MREDCDMRVKTAFLLFASGAEQEKTVEGITRSIEEAQAEVGEKQAEMQSDFGVGLTAAEQELMAALPAQIKGLQREHLRLQQQRMHVEGAIRGIQTALSENLVRRQDELQAQLDHLRVSTAPLECILWAPGLRPVIRAGTAGQSTQGEQALVPWTQPPPDEHSWNVVELPARPLGVAVETHHLASLGRRGLHHGLQQNRIRWQTLDGLLGSTFRNCRAMSGSLALSLCRLRRGAARPRAWTTTSAWPGRQLPRHLKNTRVSEEGCCRGHQKDRKIV